MERDSALLIVDVQNDFCPGGALGVPEGDRVVEPLNRAAERFAKAGLPVFASRDWHPAVTRHFGQYGGTWPPHCVQGTPGADFHPGLRLPAGTMVISKGTAPDLDSYSAFEGFLEDGATLASCLAMLGVSRIYIGGLATDYCVRSSALDAVRAGLGVTVLTDGVAGVDQKPGDSALALEEMVRAGVRLVTVDGI
ncbi:MAG: bifunctional nicotinamidase/pyrazinamidase [Oryzomonas sp.]|uniref:bifunctional nicotinamidase/pyrazinamidase n=1 Tax=Oryzomonas sp. TaxID=2855186 RepID=UPI002845F68C|nr:bifunctional nicotinamidase/pyrazinamidase [Oryzomonas sp.]MDR3580830.1 bifunctional nicotinamidase/pyrazinamidase [Oryzomonas sp.]